MDPCERLFTHMVQESQTSSFWKRGIASTELQPVSWNQTKAAITCRTRLAQPYSHGRGCTTGKSVHSSSYQPLRTVYLSVGAALLPMNEMTCWEAHLAIKKLTLTVKRVSSQWEPLQCKPYPQVELRSPPAPLPSFSALICNLLFLF